MRKSNSTNVLPSAAPLTGQHARPIQAFGSVVPMPIALAESTRRASTIGLNQLLADTITLRDLYKKHHWQVSGPTFYPSSSSASTNCATCKPSSRSLILKVWRAIPSN